MNPTKTGDEIGCSERVSSSWSIVAHVVLLSIKCVYQIAIVHWNSTRHQIVNKRSQHLIINYFIICKITYLSTIQKCRSDRTTVTKDLNCN